jgi:hypothetical protein
MAYKTWFLGMFLTLLTFQADSQVLISILLGDKLNSPNVEFGLEGGINYSNIRGFETRSFVPNFYLGFYFNLRLKSHWWINTGVRVKSNLGTDQLSLNDLQTLETEIFSIPGNYSQRIGYFMIPALLKYKLNNSIFFEIGPQIGLRLRSTFVQFDANEDNQESRIRTYNKEEVNPFDVGAMAGIGYTFFKGTGLTFGLKYYYGLTQVYKESSGYYNQSIFLQFNIPIGVGKKTDAE